MYLWRKSATPRWLGVHEAALRAKANAKLAVIEQPGRKKLQMEVCCKSTAQARPFVRQFGGRIEKLPRDWFQRFSREQKTKPIKIGKRLVISNVGGTLASRLRTRQRKSVHKGPSHIVIPRGAAFGTGDHATTAMSLRLLEEVSRKLKPGWSLVDLGTGSGILALAAKSFGARRVIAIDNDARAIATARENARMNRIDKIDFKIGDARSWKLSAKLALSEVERVDIVTANLFSKLLIEILPRLKRSLKHNGRIILSGLLRTQERELQRALRSQKIDIMKVRRRGKWVAMLAKL
jgi:ribosomal protein L11 methyltransferase